MIFLQGFIKFDQGMSEKRAGQNWCGRIIKWGRRNNNNNKKQSKSNMSHKLRLGAIIIIRNGAKTISLQTSFEDLITCLPPTKTYQRILNYSFRFDEPSYQRRFGPINVGLLNLRTTGPSDYWTFGISIRNLECDFVVRIYIENLFFTLSEVFT